jgi:hypothetical protein
MLKKVIAGWNAAPGAPRDWDPERDGECGALPIRVFPRIPLTLWAGSQNCESGEGPGPEEM